MFFLGLTFGDCDDLIEGARYNAFEGTDVAGDLLFFREGILRGDFLSFFEMCFSFHILFPSHDRVSFSATGLSVCENGAIVAFEDVFDYGKGALFVDLLL